MADRFPPHPLTGKQTFRNPGKVSVATWEVMQAYTDIVSTSMDGGEQQWIERVWRELEKTIWVQHSDEFEWHRVMLRYFSLVELVHIYCHLADIASFGREYKLFEWVSQCRLSKVKLALMCGEDFLEDRYVEEDGPAEVVDRLLDEEYPSMVEFAQELLGGSEAMLVGLRSAIEPTADNRDDSACDADEDAFAYGNVSDEEYNLMQWRDEDFPRSGLDGYR